MSRTGLTKQIQETRIRLKLSGQKIYGDPFKHPVLGPLYRARAEAKRARKLQIKAKRDRKKRPRYTITRTVQYDYAEADNAKLKEFYASREWKLMRYEALRLHGGRCQCCGASPREGRTLNVDHIKPLRAFWALRLELDNLQVLCADCNEGKGARHSDDWR